MELPRADANATLVLLLGLAVTWIGLTGDRPTALARFAAAGIGASLACSCLIELKKGWKSLLRADLVAMAALYFLLFFEFLFPQAKLDVMVQNKEDFEEAISAALVGFATIAIGRHAVGTRVRQWKLVEVEMPKSTILVVFWISFIFGYLYMLATVNFNVFKMVAYFMEPRFNVPWGRGRLGDATALVYELGAILYLVPPLAGVILGRRSTYSRLSVFLVTLGLLFTLFYGFTSGTRNIIGSYLIMFLVGYGYASTRSRTDYAIVGALCVTVFLASTFFALQFRNVGLGKYMSHTDTSLTSTDNAVYVDYNLYVISQLVAIFPKRVEYLGWKVPLWLVARPVPRVIWPGKPTGEDISAETYLGIPPGTTVSSTFVGEAYMAAGLPAVAVAGFGFGLLGMWWTRKTLSVGTDFGLLVHCSGFFAMVISMRSMYMLPVALMPTLAAIVIGYALAKRGKSRTA